jgi:hypothetical protein
MSEVTTPQSACELHGDGQRQRGIARLQAHVAAKVVAHVTTSYNNDGARCCTIKQHGKKNYFILFYFITQQFQESSTATRACVSMLEREKKKVLKHAPGSQLYWQKCNNTSTSSLI